MLDIKREDGKFRNLKSFFLRCFIMVMLRIYYLTDWLYWDRIDTVYLQYIVPN